MNAQNQQPTCKTQSDNFSEILSHSSQSHFVMSPSAIDVVAQGVSSTSKVDEPMAMRPLESLESININGATYVRLDSYKEMKATLPLAGKVALITGSSRGIGRGIALELGLRGASVVVNYAKGRDAAESVVKEIESYGSHAIAIQADVSKPESISDMFKQAMSHFGKIDIVVSNSGTEIWEDEANVTQAQWDYIFSINSRGQFFVAQQGLKYVSEGGRIILTSSIAATASFVPNHALYAGSKASVEGFARSFAIDCGHKRITCNAIAPGGIKTDMFDANAWHYAPGGYEGMPLEAIEKGIASACPLKRIGLPSDVGKAVALLASPDSEWINGT